MLRDKLVQDYGEPAVVLAEEFRNSVKEREQQATDGSFSWQVSELRGDGHGLNFIVDLEDGWHRIIITSA